MDKNIILATDSYKLTHWNQYPLGTETVYSYLESRVGAMYPQTVFYGLQGLLMEHMAGNVVTYKDLLEAAELSSVHFGSRDMFNYPGWLHIVQDHAGILPLRIKAVPEGMPIPTGNLLMTVENTCPQCFWLTNVLESLLLHVWYPSTVASVSYTVKKIIANYVARSTDNTDTIPFMLHDFGYRGASSHEAAAIGGSAHLVNFLGTDTLPALQYARDYYGADYEDLGFSIPATEHSVMTALGKDQEFNVTAQLLDAYSSGVLAIVGDSYNILDFVAMLSTELKDKVMKRDGKLVIRPDSCTPEYKTPAELMVHLSECLWAGFGGTENKKRFRVFDPHVGLIWGDGLDVLSIGAILDACTKAGFSAENYVFGMGGGLLQKKIDRDTQRFAFKSSAQKREMEWFDIYKEPLDVTKRSKRGRLKLIEPRPRVFETLPFSKPGADVLQTVFENGILRTPQRFDEIRRRAELG